MSDTTRAPTNRWFKFSLRSLLVALTIFGLWLGWHVNHAYRQKAVISAIESIDGYYYYDFQYDPPETYDGTRAPPGPTWLWEFIDKDMFFDVAAVGLNCKPATDETVQQVGRLTQLQQLDLASANAVSDRSLKYLERLRHLNYLRLDGTSVSDDAANDFQRRHPTVEVVR